MQNLDDMVAAVSRDNPECMGALLLGEGGAVQASDGSHELLQTAVAIALPLRELLDRSAAELGAGAFATALIEGTDASFALADIDGVRTVIVVGREGAAQGSLLADARYLAESIRQVDSPAISAPGAQGWPS